MHRFRDSGHSTMERFRRSRGVSWPAGRSNVLQRDTVMMATRRSRFGNRPTDTGEAHIGGMISADELERAALAADPDTPIPDDAKPFGLDESGPELLPAWYMPVPQDLRRTPARRVVVAGIIASLVIVNGAGLCVTYGWPEIAW